MSEILILKKLSSGTDFFEVEKTECDDETYSRYIDICDSYYFKIEIKRCYENLRFGYSSSDTETIEAVIPHENILIKDGEVKGFLYDTSQTPDGVEGYNGQIVFLLEDEGKKRAVGGRATVGCNSSFETCTLLTR